MNIEHMRRQPSVHLKTIGRRDPLIEPERGDAKDFGERRFPLGRRIVLQPPRELTQDRILAMATHAYNERHAEFFPVGVIEAMKIGGLLLARPVEPGGGLLGCGIGGQFTLARGFAGKIRMAVDQRALALVASLAHRVDHGLVESRQTGKWPRRKGCFGDPGRMLHRLAQCGDERPPVNGVEGIERNGIHKVDRASCNHRSVGAEIAVFAVPVARDVKPRRDPDTIKPADVIEEARQPSRPAGTAGEAAMQTD